MTKKSSKQYKIDHLLAKVTLSVIVCFLLHLDGSLTLYTGLIVVIWLFGVNTLHHLVEIIFKHKHKVPWL